VRDILAMGSRHNLIEQQKNQKEGMVKTGSPEHVFYPAEKVVTLAERHNLEWIVTKTLRQGFF
jgi:hypothetical protein